jgi:ribosome recycling factor
MDVDDILLDCEDKMSKTLDNLRHEFTMIRSGRATTGLVENVKVPYYGSLTPLHQIATIGAPDPQLIVIKPYDPSAINDVEKALLKSDIGIVPNSDGKIIRLSVPPLSEERRKQIATSVKEMAEEARIALRNIRRDANKNVDVEQKDKKSIGEDDAFRAKEEIQKILSQSEEQIAELVEKKTAEVMEV